MAVIETKKIRNIALLGHGGCGKTSIAEAMIYLSGASDRLGKVTDGNTVLDYDPEETKRGFSLNAAVANIMWKDIKINIIDTPGYLDFVGEALQSLRVADSAIISVDAKAGVEVGTELAFDKASKAGIPIVFFVNKCDDADADFGRVFNELHDKFGKSLCPVFLPLNAGKDVTMLDLVEMKVYKYDEKGKRFPIDLTDEHESHAADYKEVLMEALAETSDELLNKYFDGEEITKEEAVEALHNGIISGSITPVFCGSAVNLWGITTLLDAIVDSFPRHTAKKNETLEDGTQTLIKADGDTAIFVFKTIADPFVGKMSLFKVMNGNLKKDTVLYNLRTGETEKIAKIFTLKGKAQSEVEELACGDIGMLAKLGETNTNDTLTRNSSGVGYRPTVYPVPYLCQAIVPATAKDESKISQSIAKMLEEDLTLRYENNAETKQMLIFGLGDIHLAVLMSKLKTRFGVNINYEPEKIAYREKITKKVDVEGKHKKQTGGSGQYGHVKIRFAPGSEEGLTFTVSVVGGSVPKNFNPAVEKGLVEAMAKGVVGFPLVQLAADLYDGSYHDVDSDEISFRSAAHIAYRKCLELAAPVLLEPVGNLDITVPESLVGDVMGDLNKRRGSVMGMDSSTEMKGYTTVHAIAPKSELIDYPITLRAMTQGRGYFAFTVTDYDVVPTMIASKIIEAHKKV